MICAIFNVCAMITETPMSPLPSSSITIEVVSESVPSPPHFSSSVIVRMPAASAFSTISQEKLFSGSVFASSAAARGLTSASTKRFTVSKMRR